VTWTVAPVAAAPGEDLRAVAVDAKGRVWAGGLYGALLRSDDGAATFRHVAKLPQGGVAGLWASGEGRVVVVNGGSLLASDDDGATFAPTKARGSTYGGLRERSGTLWATGRFGALTRSGDGGRSWKAQRTATRSYLYGVGADGHGTICACGAGVVALSRDGGASSEEVSLRTEEYVRDAVIMPSGDVVVVGDGGLVARCTAGTKFKRAAAGTKRGLHTIVALGPEELVVVGSGVALHSSDAGLSWQREDLPGEPWLNDAARLPDGRVVAVGMQARVAVRS
jgi:photosystem II stability/assembly factor-like uncharacterized protein